MAMVMPASELRIFLKNDVALLKGKNHGDKDGNRRGHGKVYTGTKGGGYDLVYRF